MKKLIPLILILLTMGHAFAQDDTVAELNHLDEQGFRQGVWKVHDAEGNLKYEGQFIDNKPVGEFKYYYPGGRLKAISMMIDGGNRSRTRMFHENGRLMAVGNYLEMEKDSTWNYYSDFDGALMSTEYFIKGRLDSVLVNYFPSGQVAEEIPYTLGAKNGEWKKYFTDGKLMLKATYIHDKLEGVMVVYHQNGVPEISGIYRENFKDGLWIYFNDRGGVLKKETWLMGRLKKTETF